MWNTGIARQATDDNTVRRMRIACRMTKATDTPSEYVIFFFFSTATVVTRTCLGVTLCAYCLSVVSSFDRHAQNVAEHGINKLQLFRSVFNNFLFIVY